MKNLHTPGPWTFSALGFINAEADKLNAFPICYVYRAKFEAMKGETRDDANRREAANARLIAAAPETAAERDRLREEVRELREALEACALALSGCFETVSVKKSYSMARAVLAKTNPKA